MAESLQCPICKTAPIGSLTFITHLLGKKHNAKSIRRDLSQDKTFCRRSIMITGNKSLSDFSSIILNKYLKFKVMDIKFKKNSAFLEFTTEEMATAALKEKISLEGIKNLKVEKVLEGDSRRPNFHLMNRLKENSGFRNTELEVNAPQISFQLSELLKTISHGIHHDDLILRLISEIELKPRDLKKREEIRFLVQSFLQPTFPGCQTYLFGSSVNTLGFKDCDLDMVVDLKYDCWEARNKADAETEAFQLTNYLTKQFRKWKFAYNIIPIGRARVPIVKFNCTIGGIQVDLSFKNGMPVYNTELIKLYANSHAFVRPFLMFLRYWAKVQRVAGGGQPSTLLTNYCFCMMSLFLLMVRKPPIVPTVGKLQENLPNFTLIDDCICNFNTNIEEWKQKFHQISIIDVAYEFFEFYRELDYQEYVISPLAGALIPKIDIRKSRPSFSQPYLKNFYNKKLMLQMNTSMCVQDPFDVTHNIARGFSPNALNFFRLSCTIAADICKDIKRGVKPLSSLFEEYKYHNYSSPLEVEPLLNITKTNGKDTDNEGTLSVSSDDSVQLLQELESLERVGGVQTLLENVPVSESLKNTVYEFNGISEESLSDIDDTSVTQKESIETPIEANNTEEVSVLENIEGEPKMVEVINLEESDEIDIVSKPLIKMGNSTKNEVESGTSSKIEVKDEDLPVDTIVPSELRENTANSDIDDDDDSVYVIEHFNNWAKGSTNPSKELYSFTINYSSNCSYDIYEDGSLRPRKRGHINSSSKEKFVSDLLLFILKQVVKCSVLKIEIYIEEGEEDNFKNKSKKRSLEEANFPQKFLKINSEGGGKTTKPDFTLLSVFECQLLYRIWEKRKKLHKKLEIPLANPLQVEMFLSTKIAEDELMKANETDINVKLWKDATKMNLFWVSIHPGEGADRKQRNEKERGQIINSFFEFLSKVTCNIFSQIDEFLKWC